MTNGRVELSKLLGLGRGAITMTRAYTAAGHANAAARELSGAALYAAYADAGQAVAVAHVATHELGAAAYEICWSVFDC